MRIFDAHLHIIEPGYPLVENEGYLPEPFTCQDYRERTDSLSAPVEGGAVVSGSFQGTDQTYMTSALEKLGSGFVGVTQLPEGISDEEILELHHQGVRAARFNIKRGGRDILQNLSYTAKRIYDLVGWHAELYVDARDLTELHSTLRDLPAFSLDHLGLSKEGLRVLLPLVDGGVKVKATGFGRVDFDVVEVLKEIHKANPDALMFGTDLPSTRAPRPFRNEDIQLITDNFPEEDCEKILYQNAWNWYIKA
ncbi:amidohydrolase family protein [Salimicrobium halophilum]|uniref:Predicted metal-dependent hydrolase, TIM-barrel fold n=1 Tax=Salimicrobium halophilum TaxID=86666 RepID=A0A1G8T508_9BACI|nr:amidohydrolase family protein [Salimicrobium halophilum]SDJ36504.1 Predicted metal-dependent hydrolase, TIM-barrel fold [Salimicrobium halophilum]